MWTILLIVLIIALTPTVVSAAAKFSEWFEKRFSQRP